MSRPGRRNDDLARLTRSTSQVPELTDHAAGKRWLSALAEGVGLGRLDKDLAAETRRAAT